MIKHKLLFNALNEWAPIPSNEWSALSEVLQERVLGKGDFFLKSGTMAEEVGFIISGFCRQFYIHEDGSESNHTFNFENELVAGYPSLLEKVPSKYNIQAMENVELLVTSYAEFEEFFARHPCWERLGRKVAEWNYLLKMQRETAFLTKDAKERYLDVFETRPEIIRRVPQYHLASYLGITASALNRIIKRLEKE